MSKSFEERLAEHRRAALLPEVGLTRFQHIEKLGNEEVEGLLDGDCIIQTKIDGSNLTVAWYAEPVGLVIASRNNVVYRNGASVKFPIIDKRGKPVFDENGNPREETRFNDAIKYVLEHGGLQTLTASGFILRGEWLCLSGDSVIKKVSAGKNGKGNYMTLKEMYEYYTTPERRRSKSWWERYGMPSIYSLNQIKDRIYPNRIKSIIFSGLKEAYRVNTRLGYSIKTSRKHPFLTNRGWTRLEDIKEGDVVAVTELSHNRVHTRRLGQGARNILKRQRRFVSKVGKCQRCGAEPPQPLELDHKDEDYLNNAESNWQVLCYRCHRIKSGESRRLPHTKGYAYVFDKVISISLVGKEEMYDIEMEKPFSNFIANGFIVHNCQHSVVYDKENYGHFYLFDVQHASTGDYVHPDDWIPLAESSGVRHIPVLTRLNRPTMEALVELTKGPDSFGAKQKEGIVVKRYDGWSNKYGRTTWGKLVSAEYTEKMHATMGATNQDPPEIRFVARVVTFPFIMKTIKTLEGTLARKLVIRDMPRVLCQVWHDAFTEELWDFVRDESVKAFDFKTARGLVEQKTRDIALTYFNGLPTVWEH